MKIFITGSTDGIGKLAAKDLLRSGHEVVLHARNEKRKQHIMRELPEAKEVVVADLGDIKETIQLADDVNQYGTFDAVIHNAGVYRASRTDIFQINCLAPYIHTSLINRPKRLVYVSSGLHLSGNPRANLKEGVSYSDSKFYLVLLSNTVARKWTDVYSNSINPGWVPTKMGGSGAPDDLQKGYETQVWLATSNDPKVKVSGRYFFHQQEINYHSKTTDTRLQEDFLQYCEDLTGIRFPS